ncbi:AAA family ATPase [Paenibacillus odorifer]|uniref:AAA family ATPase n=1 Tax=Paenibacillus TaxID=44249 RepID=UPI00112FE736
MIKKLKDYIKEPPIEIEGFIELSIPLTELVLREHQENGMIGCLSPVNISIQWDEKTARMIKIGVGNAAYRSPEQSGRINRVPDERSDLYAVGVIFYELFTGQLPFLPEDGEDWSTVHISRKPQLHNRLEGEGPLQNILMKLLAKSPEDRYQSAYGLLEDLKWCRDMLNKQGSLTPFEVGRLDQIRSLGRTDNWYGRSAVVEQVEAKLEQAAQGMSVFSWVSGQEGIGKTTLVRRLQLKVARRGGMFVEGRAEPLQQTAPYEPILQALRQWVDQLWSEPADVISQLKIKLQAEFGRDVREIVTILPEIHSLFGTETEVSAAVDEENGWDRARDHLPHLMQCMAECKPPLVLFIDNLEWADHGTHAVLDSLVKHTVPGLFLIGTSRMTVEQAPTLGEPNLNHFPEITWLVERWRTNSEEIVALLPLTYEEVSQYVSDALHENSARIRLLARSVYNQSGGNPRAIRLILEGWLQEKKLSFDDNRHQWSWDPEVIRQMGDPEAHLRLMEVSFTKLSNDTKQLLAMAAAIGSAFRLSILAKACDMVPDAAFHGLQEVEAEGIIYREDEDEQGDRQDRIYLFVHECIHRMAYDFDSGRNADRHRRIGQLLQRSFPKWSDNTTLTAIDHLNLAASVLSGQEVRQLVEHNLQAGKKALADGRYVKGKEYAENGIRLLTEYKELESGELNVQLQLVLAWTEYMGGQPDRARVLLSDLNKNTKGMSRSKRSCIWVPLIQFHAFVDNEAAIAIGKEALEAYGWKLQENSSLLSIAKEVTRTGLMLYRKRNKSYLLSDALDEEYTELCLLLEQLFFPLFMHDARALLEFYARFIRYGLQKGLNESLAVMIVGYELIIQRVLPNYVQAPSIAKRVFSEMVNLSNFNQHSFNFASGMFKQMDKPSEAFIMMYKSMRQGLESGERDFANLALITCLVTYSGDLDALKELLQYYEENMRQFASDKTQEIVRIAESYMLALQDESKREDFISIPQVPSSGASKQQEEDNYGCVCRLEVAYLSGNYEEALYWAKQGRQNELSLDWTRIRKQRFYESLSLAAIFLEKNEEERKQIRQAIRRQLRKMKSWRGFLGNRSSAYLLMKAEDERMAGNPMAAVHGYMAAIGQARAEKYALIEGIACERLAICYKDDLISGSGAMINMMDACAAFAEWGITSKVAQIKGRYADLLVYPAAKQQEEQILEQEVESDRKRMDMPQLNTSVEGREEAREGEYELVRQLIEGVSKLKQASWMTSLLEAALRQSGADWGLLLSRQGDGFAIEAGGSDRSDKQTASGLYAESVLSHTALTGKPLLLHDAIRSFWVKDHYIEAQQPRSILCIPIAVPGDRASYLLYLENRKLPGVFTDRDVKVLELVATRMIYVELLEGDVGGAVENISLPLPVPSPDQTELSEPLTDREYEILMNIAEGLSNREIAERLGIAETTVKTHVSRVIGKLGVKRRGQAVVRARELQLID